jgi:glycosyltransferase involved in cell wall biosynthesis
MGGLNSISRKNINNILDVFYQLEKENKIINWELNIYIQGVEYPSDLEKYQHLNSSSRIKIYIQNNPYSEVIDIYHKNDILIHMGTHEGLGLGFYESLYTGTPVLTFDWSPNNEIIQNNVNGWCIPCDYEKMKDNTQGLVHKALFLQNEFRNKIIELCTNTKETYQIIQNTIQNRGHYMNENKKIYEQRWLSILS